MKLTIAFLSLAVTVLATLLLCKHSEVKASRFRVKCPECGALSIQPALALSSNGGFVTNGGVMQWRSATFKCQECKKQFTVPANPVFVPTLTATEINQVETPPLPP